MARTATTAPERADRNGRSRWFPVRRLLSAALAAWLMVVAAAVPASAQMSGGTLPAAESVARDLEAVLRRGLDLERQQQWADALGLYEEALRFSASDERLRSRLDYARAQYDLGRRYSDSGFLRMTDRLSQTEALSLYNDLLLKMQSYYVDVPNWRRLVEYGTMSLQVALNNPKFVQQQRLNVTSEQVDAFLRELRARLRARPIDTRHDARDAVLYAARFAEAQLGLSPTAVILEYNCGATNSLDLYSSFLTGDELNEVYSQIDGNFVGIGIELKAQADGLLLVRIIPGSPAAAAGLQAGQRILEVDGVATLNMNTAEAADLLQGAEGSWVDLVVADADNNRQRLRVQRRRVDVPSVDDVKIVDPQMGIGYMKLVTFQKSTVRDVDAALWKLHRQGMRSLILDLRGNPGGLLSAAVEVADKFIEAGTIVSTRGRNPREDHTYTAQRGGTWRVPLVVLIDHDSASASEILAGAIRDLRRGTIVGTRSYGKGSVQGIFPLARNGAGVRLTTAKFYSPTGKPYSYVGVEPHVVVQSVARPIVTDGQAAAVDTQVDPVLEAGLRVFRSQISQR